MVRNIVQNTDTKVRFTLQDDSTTSVPYVISALNAYEVYVYRVVNNTKTLLGTYKNTNTGTYAIAVYSSANGQIDIVINRQMTRNFVDGDIYAEVKVRLSAGTEFISSFQNIGVNGVKIGKIVSSANINSLK